MLDIFGTRRIAELQAALIEAGKLLMRAKEEMAYLEQERDTAREEARTLDAAVRDLSAECTRLSTALNEATRLLDEREQYSVKRPRRAKVQISLESAPQEQEQME